MYDPALERLEAIDADLAHWAPGADRVVDSPGGTRILRPGLADAPGAKGAGGASLHPLGLGDLSGGQAIGRILGRSFDLGGEGLAFYDFPMRPKPYKDAYRDRLDRLGLDGDEIDRVVDEVKLAFSLNQRVFDELAENLPAYRR